MTWHLSIYDALLYSAAAGFVVLAIASAVLLAIRQPARRIRVIEITLAGLVVLPLLALIPGYPRFAVLPAIDPVRETFTIERPPAPAPVVAEAAIAAQPAPSPMVADNRPAATPTIAEASPPAPSMAPQATPSTSPPASSTPAWQLPRDFRLWIVMAYLVGTVAMIAWSLLGLAAMARLLRSTRPADDACRAVLRDVAGAKSDRVSLVVSPRAAQPCALAWRRPTIVLPQSLADGGDLRQLRFALAHEWSHIARGDVWMWGLSSVARWFYFYQPLLWHLRRPLRLCQDYLADAAAAGTLPEDYAEFLTSYSAHLKHPNLATGLGIGGRASELRRRIVMLVENRRLLETAVPRRWNLFVAPLAVLLLAAVACVRSEPGDAPEAGAKPQSAARTAAMAVVPPFSGRIRPGDILKIDLAGGFPSPNEANRDGATVEPDGNVALGAYYGRVQVAGKTLIEAEEIVEKKLREILKDPRVQLTYVGHDPDVEAAGTAPPATFEKQRETNEPLQPLDTVEILMPQKQATQTQIVDGKATEFIGLLPPISGTYVIEPDGAISLPHDHGRVNVKGMDARQAGEAIRRYLSEKLITRTALPAVHVVKRGRAVFPEGKRPQPDYRIHPGDQVMVGSQPTDMFNYPVAEDGTLPSLRGREAERINVEGMTLAEAQAALRDAKNKLDFAELSVTIGGWREEADPDVIDVLEAGDATRVQRIERELQELKTMIRDLRAKP